MGVLLTIIITLACLGIILFVLVQNPKGGGLNSEFGSAVQLGGAKRATDILEKGTWGLAIAIAVICLGMAAGGGSSTGVTGEGDEIEVNTGDIDAGSNVPTVPTQGLPTVP